MPKSVKEILVEREHFDSLKGLYGVLDGVVSASSALANFSENKTIKSEGLDNHLAALKESLDLEKRYVTSIIKYGVATVRGLQEAKQFEDDFNFAHFSHGLMTCYIDPATNRFVLTKDSRNGLHNYDTIVYMTKNDIKNIIKCCNDMLNDVKAERVPDEEEVQNA